MGLFRAWLDRRVTAAATAEITQFVLMLRGYDIRELALVAAQAADVRGKMIAHGIDLTFPQLAIMQWPQLLGRVTQGIIDLQTAGEPFRAPGLMVWCHTLRAEQRPEIRYLAKEMWALLEKGFDAADEAARGFEEVTGYRLQPAACLLVPEGYRLGA